MPAAEPPTAAAPALAQAFARIAELRAEGWALLYPEAGELARLARGREVVIVPLPCAARGTM